MITSTVPARTQRGARPLYAAAGQLLQYSLPDLKRNWVEADNPVQYPYPSLREDPILAEAKL